MPQIRVTKLERVSVKLTLPMKKQKERVDMKERLIKNLQSRNKDTMNKMKNLHLKKRSRDIQTLLHMNRECQREDQQPILKISSKIRDKNNKDLQMFQRNTKKQLLLIEILIKVKKKVKLDNLQRKKPRYLTLRF